MSSVPPDAQQKSDPAAASAEPAYRAVVNTYCLSCHNSKSKAGGLELDTINAQPPGDHAEAWEKVVRKLRARQMPPVGARRPDEAAYTASLASLEASLDRVAAATPNPGRTDTFRRLNRTEYHNAIRDLLALDIDVAALLPSDSASFGFDNITVGNLSPTLLESYVTAAEKISRLAVGRPSLSMGGSTVRIKPDITQENHLDGLPIGTRGGALISHEFPLNGEYEISIRLSRDRNEHIEGLLEPHEIELLLDDERLRLFTIEPLKLEQQQSASDAPSHANLDNHLKLRVPVTRRTAQAGRRVSEEAVPAARDRASALRGSLQLLPASAAAARGVRDLDRRSLQRGRRGRHAEPPSRARVPAGIREERRRLREEDFVDADAAGVSAARQ